MTRTCCRVSPGPPWLPLAVAFMAYGGFFWIWMFAGTNTSVQLRSPPPLLGRMLGLYQLSVIGPIALGSLAAGALAEGGGIRWSLGACAAGLLAWGLWSLTHPVPAIDARREALSPTPTSRPAAAVLEALGPGARAVSSISERGSELR